MRDEKLLERCLRKGSFNISKMAENLGVDTYRLYAILDESECFDITGEQVSARHNKEQKISEPTFSEEVLLKAKHILEQEDPLSFLLNAVSKYHKGDGELILFSLCCSMTPWVNATTLHPYGVGDSGTGKSDLFSKVLRTFHQNYYVVLTSLSPKSLYYAWREGELRARQLIFFDDVLVSDEGIATLKAFTTGKLVTPSLWTVVEKKFVSVRVDGTYSVFLSSVNPVSSPELKNRFLLINPTEDEHADDEVHDYQQVHRTAEGESFESDDDLEICRAMTHILLQNVDDVEVPFTFEWECKHDRRLFPFFISLIKAITKIYRFQRPKNDGHLVSCVDDVALAVRIWRAISQLQSTKSNKNAEKVLSFIIKESKDTLKDYPGYREIANGVKLSRSTVQACLFDLEATGLVDRDKVERRWVFYPSAKCRTAKEVPKSKLAVKRLTRYRFDPSAELPGGCKEKVMISRLLQTPKIVGSSTKPITCGHANCQKGDLAVVGTCWHLAVRRQFDGDTFDDIFECLEPSNTS